MYCAVSSTADSALLYSSGYAMVAPSLIVSDDSKVIQQILNHLNENLPVVAITSDTARKVLQMGYKTRKINSFEEWKAL